jgi:hypothetical protein
MIAVKFEQVVRFSLEVGYIWKPAKCEISRIENGMSEGGIPMLIKNLIT